MVEITTRKSIFRIITENDVKITMFSTVLDADINDVVFFTLPNNGKKNVRLLLYDNSYTLTSHFLRNPLNISWRSVFMN